MEDERIKKLNEHFDIMSKRTEVEQQAEKLIAECKFQEAQQLLKSLDDTIIGKE